MKLIVALGNPGPKYELTRHNAGFLILDQITHKIGCTWIEMTGQFKGEVAKGELFDEKCLFLKPLTFMNLSGQSVGAIMRYYKIAPKDLVVLHDDIDVPFGKVKTREGGSSGGHNGIRSIIEHIGTEEFSRVKLGVGKPNPETSRMSVADWVLQPMPQEELDVIAKEMVTITLDRMRNLFLLKRKSS